MALDKGTHFTAKQVARRAHDSETRWSHHYHPVTTSLIEGWLAQPRCSSQIAISHEDGASASSMTQDTLNQSP